MIFRSKNRTGKNQKNNDSGRRTILVIDDDDDLVKYTEFILEESGYRVISALRGGDGLKLAKKQHPDLILLDINMPTLGGYDVCHELKANPKTKDIPVVMFSAEHRMSGFIRSAEEGAVAFVGKPIQREDLLVKIAKHLPPKE